MLDDFIELATTAVHRDHTPDLAHPISKRNTRNLSSNNNTADDFTSMPPRRRRASKSQSISSATGPDTDSMPPPALPLTGGSSSTSKSPSPTATRHRRGPSSSSLSNPNPNIPSNPGSPAAAARQLANALTTRPGAAAAHKKEEASLTGFIGVTVLSLVLSSALRTAASTYTTLGRAEIAAISDPKRSQDEWYVGGLLLWRIVVVGVYWFSGYDVYDVASLSVLTATPVALLEGLFYQITPSVLLVDILAGIISAAVPFGLLRSIAPAHHPSDKSTKYMVRNRPILTDPYTTAFTSVLAATIFAVLLELCFETFLPRFLTVHFEYIRTLEPAHRGSAQLPILLVALLPAGVACRSFLFAPSTSAPAKQVTELDTVRSGLVDHVRWNLWGWYTSRQKELITRAALLATLMSAETLVQCAGALQGVELQGAAGYAAVWVVGVTVVSGVLDWVGKPSD